MCCNAAISSSQPNSLSPNFVVGAGLRPARNASAGRKISHSNCRTPARFVGVGQRAHTNHQSSPTPSARWLTRRHST